MEERKDNNKNIKILRQRIKDEKVKELISAVKKSQSTANSIAKLLADKENELRAKANEAKKVEVAPQVSTVEETVKTEPAPVVSEKPVKKTSKKQAVEKANESIVEQAPIEATEKVAEDPVVEQKVESAPAKEGPKKEETPVAEPKQEQQAEPQKKSILSFIVKKAEDRKPEPQKKEYIPTERGDKRQAKGDRVDRQPQGDKGRFGARPTVASVV